jgi:hypothetical protein
MMEEDTVQMSEVKRDSSMHGDSECRTEEDLDE